MYSKSELTALWRMKDFRPRKRWGQNFLIDKNIKNKIIAAADPKKDDSILEIGPGFGELTQDLALNAKKVRAVERDRKIAEILRSNVLSGFKNIELIAEDILKYKIDGSFNKIVGNLPYYITTPIIEKIIESKSGSCGIFIMVQKEYGERLAAKPGNKNYSSLSCFVQLSMEAVKLFTVTKNCFYPRPEVDSVFLMLKPIKNNIPPGVEKLLLKIIRTAFQKRRKKIINAVSGENRIGMDKELIEKALKVCGIGPNARPENISIKQYRNIAETLYGYKKNR